MSKDKQLTEAETKNIIGLYNQGYSMLQIGWKLNLSRKTINDILKERGIKIRTRFDQLINNKGLDESKIKKIIELYLSGKSIFEIGKIENLNPPRIYSYLKKNNIQFRDRNQEAIKKRQERTTKLRNSEEALKQDEIIKKEYLKGTPMKEIAKLTGLGETTVTDRLHKRGIQLNRTHNRGERKKIKCACGCGEMIWSLDSQRRFRNYKNGHYSTMQFKKLLQHKDSIVELYQIGYNTKQIAKIYNITEKPITKVLKMQGIEIFNRTTFGKKSTAMDGHITRSGMELEVDNYFFNNKILHIYEKQVGETNYRCDFFIPETNTYIEVCGINTKTYLKNLKKKIKTYESLGLINNLILIFPNEKVEDKLRFLLSLSKVQRGLKDYEN